MRQPRPVAGLLEPKAGASLTTWRSVAVLSLAKEGTAVHAHGLAGDQSADGSVSLEPVDSMYVNEARAFYPVPKIGSVQWGKAELLVIEAKVEYLVFPKSTDGFVFTELIDPMDQAEMLSIGAEIESVVGNEVEVPTLEMKKVGKSLFFEETDAVVSQEEQGTARVGRGHVHGRLHRPQPALRDGLQGQNHAFLQQVPQLVPTEESS
ncbi:hypothetical protein [Streptomyces sp. cmx-10-25]|uniref:hypothetical protein n=1 Tax=Streptomyces sp. cmx-10-25 TaxID=2790919 RepID=UPI00398040FD